MHGYIASAGTINAQRLTQWHSIAGEAVQIAGHLIDNAIVEYEESVRIKSSF